MKGSNPGTMLENPKKKEGIESRHDTREPETKRRDRIPTQCRRTQNKKGSNPGTMPENPKQKKGIEFEHDAEEPETKRKRSNPGAMPNNLKQKERITSKHDAREPKTKRWDRIQARCQRTRNKRRDRMYPKA